ncbi:MAG: hypothetical protein Q4E99_03925, partial [Bacillota bacterium]|nr:hypothetical protein [Bacillota bacterium]
MSFLYPVKDLDSAHPVVTSVYCKDIAGHEIDSSYKPNPNSNSGLALNNATMSSCLPEDSLSNVTYSIDQTDPAHPVLIAKAVTSTQTAKNAWMADDINADGTSKSIKIAIRGFDKKALKLVGTQFDGATMTTSIELMPTEAEKQFTVEMYKGNDLLVGSLQYVTQEPAKYIQSDEITLSTTVKTSTGAIYQYSDPSNPVIKLYEDDMPVIKMLFDLQPYNYVYCNKKLVTVFGEDGKPLDADAHFAWKSNNPEIANIDAEGNVIPTGKSGEVSFTLYAFNGSEEKTVYKSSKSIKINGSGLQKIKLANTNIKAMSGKAIPLYWSCGAEDAEYKVEVINKSNVVYSATTSSLSLIIPESTIIFDYSKNADNTYTVKVSNADNNTTGTIELYSAPAVVKLDNLATYYYQDILEGTTRTSIDLGWNITNYDTYSSGNNED